MERAGPVPRAGSVEQGGAAAQAGWRSMTWFNHVPRHRRLEYFSFCDMGCPGVTRDTLGTCMLRAVA